MRNEQNKGIVTEALSEAGLRFDAKLPKNTITCKEESTIKLPHFLKSKHLLPVRHEEKRAIQPILPLLLLERKRDMPPPPSSPPLKQGKSTDLKHKREQNEREQNFTTKRKKIQKSEKKQETENSKKKNEKENKHRDYSGSKKKNLRKPTYKKKKFRKLILIDRVRVFSVRVSVLAARTERNKQASKQTVRVRNSLSAAAVENQARNVRETEIATIVATYLVHGVSVQTIEQTKTGPRDHPAPTNAPVWMDVGWKEFISFSFSLASCTPVIYPG